MPYDTVRHVNDSYVFRVAPDVRLAVESYLPCDYAPKYKISVRKFRTDFFQSGTTA